MRIHYDDGECLLGWRNNHTNEVTTTTKVLPIVGAFLGNHNHHLVVGNVSLWASRTVLQRAQKVDVYLYRCLLAAKRALLFRVFVLSSAGEDVHILPYRHTMTMHICVIIQRSGCASI